MNQEATCDYCGAGLGCDLGSLQDVEYWRDHMGLFACDQCALSRADDFQDMAREDRLFALRLRYSRGVDITRIRAAMEEARGAVVPEQLEELGRSLQRAASLHRDGERLAGVEAGQAAWNTASSLRVALSTRSDIVAGQQVKRQRSSAGFSSGEERRADRATEWAKWQEEASAIFARNPEQSKAEICRKVAERFGVTSRAVSGRVNVVGKERRRSK